jgi:hypothetical protein
LNFEWFLDVLRGMGVFRADTTVHFHCQRAKSTNPKGTLSPCRIYIIVYLDMNIYIYVDVSILIWIVVYIYIHIRVWVEMWIEYKLKSQTTITYYNCYWFTTAVWIKANDT